MNDNAVRKILNVKLPKLKCKFEYLNILYIGELIKLTKRTIIYELYPYNIIIDI